MSAGPPEVRLAPPAGFADSFADPARPGSLAGTHAPDGTARRLTDVEGVIGADHGALRIQPLIEPGWARAGIAYGPYARAGGLAFSAFVLNGHNTAQAENLTETFRQRLDRWLAGPEVHRRRQRLLRWLRSPHKGRMLRQWRWWWRARKGAAPVPRIDENLALGWYASACPPDPTRQGNGFVMHATGAENGELQARVGEALLPAVRGVQNLPIHYVVVLREQGAAYYAASLPGALGLGSHPALRPLAIDPWGAEPSVYAGLFQSTLGQIGFRLDTRVFGLKVAPVPAWSAWYGSAHAADRLGGQGPLAASAAEAGGPWQQVAGHFERTAAGAAATAQGGLAVLHPPAPSGLLHLIVACPPQGRLSVALVWRFADAENHWRLSLTDAGCELARCLQGRWTRLALDDRRALRHGTTHSLQLLDDGVRIGLHLDGALLFDRRFDDAGLAQGTGVGFAVDPESAAGVRLRDFEAHPRHCPLPPALDHGAPWWRLGTEAVLTEAFDGAARDLDGKTTSTGGGTWRRTEGSGRIGLTGDGAARVDAEANRPNPGRLAYTLDWAHPEFADLEVEITPPGTARGQKEHGRGGVIFWQDDEHYVIVNNWLNDSYGGASVSCFSCVGGFEDLYDAVWTNVGDRVRWGVPHRFRVVFDGVHLLMLVDDEPVLYRALTDIYPEAARLRIGRVGLVANWEWGNDTGSRFRRFAARV